jgi:hypothetical protein
MTTISIQSSGDISEEDAIAAIAAMGFHGGPRDLVGQTEDFHWHDFDIAAYGISGEGAIELADGTIITVGPGILVRLPRGTVHRDVPGSSSRAVLGISVPPSELSGPLNKPVDQLPA